jgi:hypothetical protein
VGQAIILGGLISNQGGLISNRVVGFQTIKSGGGLIPNLWFEIKPEGGWISNQWFDIKPGGPNLDPSASCPYSQSAHQSPGLSQNFGGCAKRQL